MTSKRQDKKQVQSGCGSLVIRVLTCTDPTCNTSVFQTCDNLWCFMGPILHQTGNRLVGGGFYWKSFIDCAPGANPSQELINSKTDSGFHPTTRTYFSVSSCVFSSRVFMISVGWGLCQSLVVWPATKVEHSLWPSFWLRFHMDNLTHCSTVTVCKVKTHHATHSLQWLLY